MNTNKICIIGQGPLFDPSKFYSTLKNVNVICSTWNTDKDTYTESEEPLKNYLGDGIIHEVIFNIPPKFSGRKNINNQILSTLYGVNHAIKRGYDFVFKCRNDMFILNSEKLLEILNLNTFNFIGWFKQKNHICLVDYAFGAPIKNMQKFLMGITEKILKNNQIPEVAITRNFIKFAKDNNIKKINYLLNDSIKHEIFSVGRHSSASTSYVWENASMMESKTALFTKEILEFYNMENK